MAWLASIGAVTAIAGSISGAKKAKKAGKYNSNLIREETAEAIRRSEAELEQKLGFTRALIGASGVQMSGSAEKYVNFLETEGQDQIAWMQKAGDLRAAASKRQGSYIASQALSQGIQTGIDRGVQAFNYYQYTKKDNGGFKS